MTKKLALILLFMAVPYACIAQATDDWRMDIEEGDWTFVGEGEGVVSFARLDPSNPRYIHFRYEYESDLYARRIPRLVEALPVYHQARSSTSIVEIDCERRRRKPREETLYPGRNLSGTVLLKRVEDRPWTTVASGSVAFQQMEWACDVPS